MTNARFFFGLFALAVLAAGSAGGWYALEYAANAASAAENGGGHGPGGGGGGPPPAPVRVAAPSRAEASTTVLATGTLLSSDTWTAQTEIAGHIAALGFEQGQAVKQGQALIRLDTRDLEVELAKAKATLLLSQGNLDRAERLASSGASTARALDEARSQRARDAADEALAESRLAKATIAAPFDGIAGLREVSLGRFVQPGDTLARVERVDPLYLDFRVPERWLAAIKVGQAVKLGVDAAPDAGVEGRIIAIDPLVDVNGRALRVRAAVPNGENRLRPGLFARVSIEVETRPDAMMVPEAAIVLGDRGAAVFTVSGDKATLAPVTTGARRDGLVEVVRGISGSASVVVSGQVRLHDGSTVTVLPRQQRAEG